VIVRDGDLRIINCLDDIQWIAQRFTGGQWRNKSFHRSRLSLGRVLINRQPNDLDAPPNVRYWG
jgi:hypothetical protein